jgi:sterol desaturase/sphingolipid hydroxylase (fatty acid hydroxylase superfamily)
MRRTDEITTTRAAALLFVGRGSPQVVLTALVVSIVLRFTFGPITVADVVVIVMTVAMIGVVEWFVHRTLLHAAEQSWTSRRLGLGRRHRTHHLDPPDVDHLLLRGVDAGLVVVGLVAASAVWVVLLTALLRVGGLASPTLAPVVTASATGLAALCHYEWTHLLVHTRYRPRSRYYARLARNHRLHHFRNEAYWYGVTTNVGDRLLGTLPVDRDAVAMSGTARALR